VTDTPSNYMYVYIDRRFTLIIARKYVGSVPTFFPGYCWYLLHVPVKGWPGRVDMVVDTY